MDNYLKTMPIQKHILRPKKLTSNNLTNSQLSLPLIFICKTKINGIQKTV